MLRMKRSSLRYGIDVKILLGHQASKQAFDCNQISGIWTIGAKMSCSLQISQIESDMLQDFSAAFSKLLELGVQFPVSDGA